MSKHTTIGPFVQGRPRVLSPPDDERGRKRRRTTNPGRYVPLSPNRIVTAVTSRACPQKRPLGLAARSPPAGAPGDTLARQSASDLGAPTCPTYPPYARVVVRPFVILVCFLVPFICQWEGGRVEAVR